MTQHNPNDTSPRKGIYLLPNLFTTAGLFAGFYAIVASMNGQFDLAAIAIFVAMVFDGLDGRVARMTNTESAFGAEYDSMADMVSFGIAPALVAYNWALHDLGKVGWLSAFIFTVSAALRLARFNTQVGIADKRFFQGLASPAAAAVVAGMVWVAQDFHVVGDFLAPFAALITVLAGLLMVTNFSYPSFKGVDLKGKVPFVVMLLIVLGLVVIALKPSLVLFSAVVVYAVWGPVYTIRSVKKLTFEHVVGDEHEPEPESQVNESQDPEATFQNSEATKVSEEESKK